MWEFNWKLERTQRNGDHRTWPVIKNAFSSSKRKKRRHLFWAQSDCEAVIGWSVQANLNKPQIKIEDCSIIRSRGQLSLGDPALIGEGKWGKQTGFQQTAREWIRQIDKEEKIEEYEEDFD